LNKFGYVEFSKIILRVVIPIFFDSLPQPSSPHLRGIPETYVPNKTANTMGSILSKAILLEIARPL